MSKVGWHLNNIASVNQGGWNVINAVPPAAVLNIPGGGTVEDIARILEISPSCHVFIRPYYPPEDNEASKGTYIENVESMIRGGHWNIIPVGQRHLQLFNEQNMPRHSQYEGFGVNLADMINFNKWFCIGYDRIKAADPTWKIGWTPLTPGNRDVYFHDTEPKNVPYYMHGLEAAKDDPTPEEVRRAIENGPCYQSLMKADEYLCHIYSMNPADEIDKDWCGLRFVVYARYFPKSMDVWIPECGISGGPSHSEPWWPVRWYTILQAYPAVKGTCWWRLGHEVQGVDPIVDALRTYVNDLPPDPPQPIPWPGVPPSPPPDPPPPPPDLCEEATNTTDDELICIVAADFHNVLTFYHEPSHGGWPIGFPDEQRAVICEWIKGAGFKDEYGTWQAYMFYWDCREAPTPEPPAANFTASPVLGDAPLTVRFIDTSLGQIDTWWWDLGDGHFTPSVNPSHTYVEPGNYTVSLTVTGPGGTDSLERIGYIRVQESSEPPPENWEEAVRSEVRTRMGLSYSPESLFVGYARDHNLGAQLTDTFEVMVGEQTLDVQAFSEGIVVVTVIQLPPEPEVSHIEH